MRVLITGSRDWRDFRTIRNALADLPDGSVIVTGAATGADHMARSAALALGFQVEDHFPDYAKYISGEAPLARNREMVEAGADLCLAFPTSGSRGTWHTVRLAEAAGIPVTTMNETLTPPAPHPDIACHICGRLNGVHKWDCSA